MSEHMDFMDFDDYGLEDNQIYPAEDPQTHYEKQLLERYATYREWHVDVKSFGETITSFSLEDIIHIAKLINK